MKLPDWPGFKWNGSSSEAEKGFSLSFFGLRINILNQTRCRKTPIKLGWMQQQQHTLWHMYFNIWVLYYLLLHHSKCVHVLGLLKRFNLSWRSFLHLLPADKLSDSQLSNLTQDLHTLIIFRCLLKEICESYGLTVDFIKWVRNICLELLKSSQTLFLLSVDFYCLKHKQMYSLLVWFCFDFIYFLSFHLRTKGDPVLLFFSVPFIS